MPTWVGLRKEEGMVTNNCQRNVKYRSQQDQISDEFGLYL